MENLWFEKQADPLGTFDVQPDPLFVDSLDNRQLLKTEMNPIHCPPSET